MTMAPIVEGDLVASVETVQVESKPPKKRLIQLKDFGRREYGIHCVGDWLISGGEPGGHEKIRRLEVLQPEDAGSRL